MGRRKELGIDALGIQRVILGKFKRNKKSHLARCCYWCHFQFSDYLYIWTFLHCSPLVLHDSKGMTEEEMVGWHHRLNGRESGWTPGAGDGQGGLMCCSSWGHKESDTTEQLNWTDSLLRGFPGVPSGKEPTCQCRRGRTCGFHLPVGKTPWRRAQATHSTILTGQSHGQRIPMAYSP